MPKGVYQRKGGWKVKHYEHSRKFDEKKGGDVVRTVYEIQEIHRSFGLGTVFAGGMVMSRLSDIYGRRAPKYPGCE